MNILVMGGTRFVGKAIVNLLLSQRHSLTLFTRGNIIPSPSVEHIKGDRNSLDDLSVLKGRTFDVIIDSSGRNRSQTESMLSVTGIPLHRLLYVSSAGVYEDSICFPIDESTPIDIKSRHYGKYETEQYLIHNKIPFTSFRPTYIYGAGNYNPIEKWFFDRITFNKVIPIPSNADIITQLGHVSDLADAMIRSLDYSICINKVYNCSAKKAVTIKGLIQLAALVCSKNLKDLQYREFNVSSLDSKSRKLFPIRLSNFFTDTSLLSTHINWEPKIGIEEGLRDSYENDYALLTNNNTDFSNDELLI